MKSHLINQAEEIFLKITNVTIQKTIPSEPDILKVQIEDKYFEIESTEAIDFDVFRQQWFKTLHCVLSPIAEDQWIILWGKILAEKAEFVEAKEVSEPVFIAKLLIEDIRKLSTTTEPVKANNYTCLEQDGVLYYSLTAVIIWLSQREFKIQLSTLSKVLVELGVKIEGIQTISYFDKLDDANKKIICWAFYPEALKRELKWNGD